MWNTANFRFLQAVWAHPFMTTPIPIFFDQLLISMNLYQHSKNQAFSSFRSRDIIYLKILQSDWPKTFWHISQEPDFSKIFPSILQLIQTSIIDQIKKKKSLHFHTHSKNLRLGLFSPFLEKISFFKKSSHNTIWAPSTILSSRKN